MNRVILAPVLGLGVSCFIVVITLCGFFFGMSLDTLVVNLLLWGLILLIILLSSKDQFWIHRRLPAMTPNHYKTVNVFLQKNKATLRDEDSDIRFEYNVKKKQLYIMRYMFTNPLRHVKEYEERKYQLITRVDCTGIPYNGWIAEPNYTISFHVKIGLPKTFATPENIGIIRSILVDLSKEDYNQNLYAKFQFDEDWLYVETFHYRLLRVMLVSTDGEIERYSEDMRPSKVVPNSTPSVRLSFVLNKAAKMSILDKVKPSDIIEKDTFEELWGEDTSFLFS